MRKHKSSWEVLLIQHGKSKYWGFPKGHPDQGESPLEAAIRELHEETALEIKRLLDPSPINGEYFYTQKTQLIHKHVTYFVAEVFGEVHLQREEVSGSIWCSLEDVAAHLTYDNDKLIWSKSKDLLGL